MWHIVRERAHDVSNLGEGSKCWRILTWEEGQEVMLTSARKNRQKTAFLDKKTLLEKWQKHDYFVNLYNKIEIGNIPEKSPKKVNIWGNLKHRYKSLSGQMLTSAGGGSQGWQGRGRSKMTKTCWRVTSYVNAPLSNPPLSRKPCK